MVGEEVSKLFICHVDRVCVVTVLVVCVVIFVVYMEREVKD